MHIKIIKAALHYRQIVISAIVFLFASGIYHYNKLPIEAFPDVSPIMVPVFAEAHGLAPEEVERQITRQIELYMNGLPDVTQVKSTSAFGLAAVYVYFTDDTDIYFARQMVSQALDRARSELPETHEMPQMGPVSTGLGQVYIYYLKADDKAVPEGLDKGTYLREVNDLIVKKQLQTVTGVTDILSIGGHVMQYQINANPDQLRKYNISLEEIITAVRANNSNAGGQYIVSGSEEYLVTGLGLLQDLDDISSISVKSIGSQAVTIGDLAEVKIGHEIRRGVATLNGKGEVVSGIVMKLFGSDTSDVISALNEKLPQIAATLPEGIDLIPYYHQADLVTATTNTVKNALIEGTILVVIVLTLFLGNFRSAFIVSLTLPLCALIAIIAMRLTGISANLMSLGGIAISIGMLGDGAIVMIENIYRHLSERPGQTLRDRLETIYEAAREVAGPIIFSLIIIIAVFIPIFSLENVEGKMFRPMAATLSYALFGSLIITVIFTPVICSYLLNNVRESRFSPALWLQRKYQPVLERALQWPKTLAAIMLIALSGSLLLIPKLGSEFMPTLEEGEILIGVTMAPSTSLEKAVEIVDHLENKIIIHAEVKEVLSRIGRPEAGSHPHPVNYAEIHVKLKNTLDNINRSEKARLITELETELGNYPGILLNFTQPIQNAFDELLSGIKSQIAIKIFGPDINILKEKAEQISHTIESIPGLSDLATEQSFGQPQLQVIADRNKCRLFGINIAEIMELVELAAGGEVIDRLYVNNTHYGINLRYQQEFRDSPEKLAELLVRNSSGLIIRLDQVAKIEQYTGPVQINRENGERRWIVQANVRDRDLGSVISDIKDMIETEISLPAGYYIEYGGQFANQIRAMTRLSVILPVVLLLIYFLLYLSLDSARQALLIFLNIPLALIGGVFGLYFAGEYLSVPAAIGFIALFGIAVQDGLVLVNSINLSSSRESDTEKAIINGTLLRLRPVLMTTLTTILGLIPLLISDGAGSEIQRPLAVVVITGLFSSTALTLLVIPSLYKWFKPSTIKEY